ncbi:MAG: hypothetical protein FWE23_00090 [Chitinivibrionia bacterium]|nr:hypothetical protein [Chitinivibrionia bacterium]
MGKMSRCLKGNKGASLVYVLITLVFVGAIAMLVLNSSRKETIDASLRASSEMARFAATSGLNYAVSWLADANNDDNVLNILLSWREHQIDNDEEPTRWLTGNANAYEQLDGMRVRVQIVNVDFSQMRRITRRVVNDNGTFRFMFPRPTDPVPNIIPVAQVNTNDPNNLFTQVAPIQNSRITVLIRSEAIDRSGSRASNLGFYTVFGFEPEEMAVEMQNIPRHALFSGGGNLWIHTPVTINGPAFVGGRTAVAGGLIAINVPAQTSMFNGEFVLVQPADAEQSLIMNIDFMSSALFEGGQVHFTNANSRFHGRFGGSSTFTAVGADAEIENGTAARRNLVMLSGTFADRLQNHPVDPWPPAGGITDPGHAPSSIIGSGLRFRGTNTALIRRNNTDVQYYTGPLSCPNWCASPGNVEIINNMTLDQISDSLGITDRNPPAVGMNIEHLIPRHHSETINGSTLNNLWENNTKYTDRAGREWLILEVGNPNIIAINPGGTFNHRAVIIVRPGTTGNTGTGGSLFNMGDSANVLLFFPQNFAGTWSYAEIQGNFRGMFYNASPDAQINLSAATGAGWIVNGSFYNAPETANSRIVLGTGQVGRITVNYNQQVICEIADLGVFVPNVNCDPDNGGGGGGGIPELRRIPEERVRTELLNRSF